MLINPHHPITPTTITSFSRPRSQGPTAVMTVSKTPIHHRPHKTATKKSSLKSTLTAAFTRHAATSGALDEYKRSISDYLDHTDDIDLSHGQSRSRTSRSASPEFQWRDLADINLPNDALSTTSHHNNGISSAPPSTYSGTNGRHNSNASSFLPPPRTAHSIHTVSDTSDDLNSDASSLSSRISTLQISSSQRPGGPVPTNPNAHSTASFSSTREAQAAAARQARIAQHQQQYGTNKVGGAGPAWHFYAPVQRPKVKKSDSGSSGFLGGRRSNRSTSPDSSGKGWDVK
jgi:hypothetical protein